MPAIQLPEYYRLNRSVTGCDSNPQLPVHGIAQLPFGKGRRSANKGPLAAVVGGWQFNGVFSAFSGLPFSVLSAGTSLDAPEARNGQTLVKSEVERFGEISAGKAFFDPLAFAPVTQARFGTAGFNLLRGPGYVGFDGGLFRNIQ